MLSDVVCAARACLWLVAGDTMVFKLSADGSRVQEFLNGALEIDNVKFIEMDREVRVFGRARRQACR